MCMLCTYVRMCHRYAKLEAGDGDATKFLRWQQDMKERAAAEEVADIERKHLVSVEWQAHDKV